MKTRRKYRLIIDLDFERPAKDVEILIRRWINDGLEKRRSLMGGKSDASLKQIMTFERQE